MATVEKDLGLVVGSTGPAGKDANISSASGKVNPGHSESPTVSIVVGGKTGAQTLDFTFDGIQGAKGSDASVPIATTDTVGKIKPDGTSITVDSSGTIKVGKVDATSLTGTVPLSNLPQGALERIVTVDDETARFQLTTSTVQLGDIVQQLDTKVMYVVVDESQLTNASGYTEFTAATATKATEADHAKSSDNAINSTDASHANYVNYHLIDTGIDLNTLRGIDKSGVYYKSADNTTLMNVPANVDPAMEAILEVIPLSTDGITEQRYTTMGLQNLVHLYVRHTDAAGNWQGWVTIGPQATIGEASHAENADNAHLANVALQLGSVDVGTDTRPIYLDDGNPKPIAGTIGDFETPIYLNGGSFDVISKVADASHADTADNATQADRATTANNFSGVLPAANGGTGASNLTSAANALIGSLGDESKDPQDEDYFISQSSGSGTDVFYKRKFSFLWNWINSKINEIELDYARTSGTADIANKLGSGTIGDESHAIYLNNGVPTPIERVALATNAESTTEAAHAIRADNADEAAALGSETIGSINQPIYLNEGLPTPATAYPVAATIDRTGLVKPDNVTITVTEDGTISVKELANYALKTDLPTAATTAKAGLVKPDGTSIKVTADGTISVDKIDTTTLVTKDEFVSLLQSNVETIRTALGLATTERNGLVPNLPEVE